MVEYAVLVSSLFQGDEENMCLNGTGVLRGEYVASSITTTPVSTRLTKLADYEEDQTLFFYVASSNPFSLPR